MCESKSEPVSKPSDSAAAQYAGMSGVAGPAIPKRIQGSFRVVRRLPTPG